MKKKNKDILLFNYFYCDKLVPNKRAQLINSFIN